MQQMAHGNAISIDNRPRYSRVKVQVTGPHAGFLSTVSSVQAAMRRAGVPLQELSNFYADAVEENEDNLLPTCLRWVDVDFK
jgi:precorrin-6B methylase 1